MRVDYYHAGTKGVETFTLDQIYEDPSWAGSRINLIDTLNLGEYQVRIIDSSTAALLYSRGYSTVFNEWQTTDEALAGTYHTFHETARFPYPRKTVRMTINRRDSLMAFREIFSVTIDPNSRKLVNREVRRPKFNVVPLMENGPPDTRVDILILGDGYRAEDMQKFRADAKHFNDLMFSMAPFRQRAKDFNVRMVEVASQDSGIDKPDIGVWKSTALGTKYNTFGVTRYVLTEANKAVRDIASAAPYDFLILLLNDNRYGAGGIFNLYSSCYTRTDVAGREWQMDYVYVHEFGHSFAGLGDEYYSSSFTDFYKSGVEPWEPNITALSDAAKIKWKGFIRPGTQIPTPWGKEIYDSLGRERAKLDRLAPDYYQKAEPFTRAQEKILHSPEYAGKVGAFEGAGYKAHGLYRPSIDCRMFSLSLSDFDPVCTAAIIRMIDFYSH